MELGLSDEIVSKLLQKSESIRRDLTTGGIVVGHQANLIDNVYGIKTIFQRQLGQRLNEAILCGRDIPKERIRKLFTAGYIELDAFESLMQLASAQSLARPSENRNEKDIPQATDEPTMKVES